MLDHLWKGPLWAIPAAFLLLAGVAWAHHGWSSYDSDDPRTLNGTIEESSYENPHGMVRLQAADKAWLVVLAPPLRMQNRGLTSDMLAAGTSATVMGYPHKTVDDEIRAERITIDGTTTELR